MHFTLNMSITGLLPSIPPFLNPIYSKLNLAPSTFKTEAKNAQNLGLKDLPNQNYKYPDKELFSRPQNTNGFHNLSPQSVENEITECISLLNKISKNGGFNSCSSVCRQVHGRLVKVGALKTDAFVGNKLVVAYARNCEVLSDARKVFDEIPKREVSAYAALIGLLCRLENWVEVFSVLGMMVSDGMLPDRFLVPNILKGCGVMGLVNVGRMVHGYVLRRGIEEDVFVGNALIDMYANCGDLRLSKSIFELMGERDVVSWTALVVAYIVHGFLDEAMETFRRMELDGVQADLISWNALISGFAQNGEVELALQTFEEMEGRGVMPKVNTWNGIISGCIQNGYYEDALDAYVKMFWSSLSPNVVTIVSILPACSGLKDLNFGKVIHGHAVKLGLCGNTHVEGSLIGMYCKCGRIDLAEDTFVRMKHKSTAVYNEMIAAYMSEGNDVAALRLFNLMKDAGPKPDEITFNTMLATHVRNGKKNEAYQILYEMSETDLLPNVVTFNILISGYQQSGFYHEALRIFQVMQAPHSGSFLPQLMKNSILPNTVTTTSALAACAELGSWRHGKEVHCYAIRKGLDSNIFVASALVDMYVKCNDIDSAKDVFWRTKDRNTVMWNTLIAGYICRKQTPMAFGLFGRMLLEGLKPSAVTFMILIQACGEIGALRSGREIHGYLLKGHFHDYSKYVASALIDMYARCGSILEAKKVFDAETDRDNAVWNSMISSFSAHGMTQNAISLFGQMEVSGTLPDGKTFIALLSACARDGLIQEGWKYFSLMKNTYGISPCLEHYTCMVGVMGTAGLLDEALEFIREMPFTPDACLWTTLLRACRIHSNPEIGEQAARALFDLEPDNASNYILLSNIYSAAGLWDSSKGLRSFLKDFPSMSVKECSCIDIRSTLHTFEKGNDSSPMLDTALDMWHKLANELRCAGQCVQDPVFGNEEDLDPLSCLHTEKLAICLGIVSLSASQPIRVSKNLRMCIDCHTSAKLISKIVGREIFVKDVSFYHHMKDGQCSCQDRW